MKNNKDRLAEMEELIKKELEGRSYFISLTLYDGDESTQFLAISNTSHAVAFNSLNESAKQLIQDNLEIEE